MVLSPKGGQFSAIEAQHQTNNESYVSDLYMATDQQIHQKSEKFEVNNETFDAYNRKDRRTNKERRSYSSSQKSNYGLESHDGLAQKKQEEQVYLDTKIAGIIMNYEKTRPHFVHEQMKKHQHGLYYASWNMQK